MPLFGDLDTLSFVGISWLNWIGHVSRMDGNRKGSQVFNNNPQESCLRKKKKKTEGGIVYRQILRNAKLQIEKKKKKWS
jgi:hypothetical protein